MLASLEIRYEGAENVLITFGGIWDKSLSKRVLNKLDSTWDSIARHFGGKESQNIKVYILSLIHI